MALVQDTIEPSSSLEPAVVGNICVIRCDTEIKLSFSVTDGIPETVTFGLGPVIPQDAEGRQPAGSFLL